MSQKLKALYKKAQEIEEGLQSSFLEEEQKNHFCKLLNTCEVEKLSKLSPRVKVGMSLEQFICFVVPIERELNKKITDFEVLIEKNDLNEKPDETNELIIVLDNIRSPFNMGAIVRTCDALGVSELLVTGYTPDLENERVRKISMGASNHILFKKFRHLSEAVSYLKNKSYEVIGAETTNTAIDLHKVKLKEKTALVFGNERFGISEADIEMFDKTVKLPMFGVKNSLNINAALTACGYEWVRQNGKL